MRHVELRRVAGAATGGEAHPRFGGLEPDLVRALAVGFATAHRKTYRADPVAYPGSITEASQVIRALLTGSLGSPCLHEMADALGPKEVRR